MQNVNIARHGITPKLEGHWRRFKLQWEAFARVAKAVRALPEGLVAIEWPVRCKYWRDSRVQRLLKSGPWHSAHVAGCMYGMRPQRVHEPEEFVHKLWRVSTTSKELAAAIERRCDGSHRHVAITGDETAATAFYPKRLAQQVHFALARWSEDCRASRSL